MVSISIEMMISLPVIIGLALLVSMIMVNMASGLAAPPIVNTHVEFVREEDIMLDLNKDGDLNDSFWVVTGSFTYKLTPNITFEPREYVIEIMDPIINEDEHVILFAICVSSNITSLVIVSHEGQVVLGLGTSS
ncbi:MAG: hypothetical protein DRO40_11185 [Thermoprotei archaeon]|nr:MAG: hypothetical protein DRO40_11185 [Thermoprotei archaeon]